MLKEQRGVEFGEDAAAKTDDVFYRPREQGKSGRGRKKPKRPSLEEIRA